VTGLAGTDEDCGFSSLSTMLMQIANLEVQDDGEVEASWQIDACRVGAEEERTETDCLGNEMTVKGAATVTDRVRVHVDDGLTRI
jgi:hypothetical protein